MKTNDEIRDLLRRADPAGGSELPSHERARMRAMLTSGTSRPRPARSIAPLLAAGAAAAIVVVALVISLARVAPPRVETVARPTPSPAALPPAALPHSVPPAPLPAPIAAKLAPRATRPRVHAARAVSSSPTGTTQIVFTAPEGTRILWFVGNPDAKEIGS